MELKVTYDLATLEQMKHLKNFNDFELLAEFFDLRNSTYFSNTNKEFQFIVCKTIDHTVIGYVGLELNKKTHDIYISPIEILKRHRHHRYGSDLLTCAKGVANISYVVDHPIKYHTLFLKCIGYNTLRFFESNGFNVDNSYLPVQDCYVLTYHRKEWKIKKDVE